MTSASLIPARNTHFQIKINSSGEIFDVPANESILDVLNAHGIHVETSCENGLCATCMTGYLEGQPEHRDLVLDDEEKAEFLCVCCSRSSGAMLLLDL